MKSHVIPQSERIVSPGTRGAKAKPNQSKAICFNLLFVLIKSSFLCFLQVGSFNYDMSRMVFINEFVPNEEDAIQSILDYGIEIRQDESHMTWGTTNVHVVRRLRAFLSAYLCQIQGDN